jgi:integrase
MATIIRRGERYRVQIRRLGAPSQSATFHTKAQALAYAAQTEAEVVGARHGLVPRRTVRQALERYRDEISPQHRGVRWERVRITKFLKDTGGLAFADRQLGQVQPADIASWRDGELKRGMASSSVRREYGLLRAVFNLAAREWGWLKVSPFRAVRPPPRGAARTRRVSDAEARAVCLALGYRRGSRPRTASQFVAASFLWCIETAMRQGEALSLERSAIALRVAHLERTKNGDDRDVPLGPGALALLALLPKEGRLFPVASGSCDTLFRRARGAAGLKDLHYHDSRREGTTRLAAKLDPLTLARVTGHRDLKTLLEVYYRPSMQAVARRLYRR